MGYGGAFNVMEKYVFFLCIYMFVKPGIDVLHKKEKVRRCAVKQTTGSLFSTPLKNILRATLDAELAT